MGNDSATSLPGASVTLERESTSAIWMVIARPSLVSHHASPRDQNRPSTRCRWRLSSMCRSACRPNVSSSPGATAVSSPTELETQTGDHVIDARPSTVNDREPKYTTAAGLDELRPAGFEAGDLATRVRHDERAVGRAAVLDEHVPAPEAHLEVAARHLVAERLDPPQRGPFRVRVAIRVAPDQQLAVELDQLAVVELQAPEARPRHVGDAAGAGPEQLAALGAHGGGRRVGVPVRAQPGVDQHGVVGALGGDVLAAGSRRRGRQRDVGVDEVGEGRSRHGAGHLLGHVLDGRRRGSSRPRPVAWRLP